MSHYSFVEKILENTGIHSSRKILYKQAKASYVELGSYNKIAYNYTKS